MVCTPADVNETGVATVPAILAEVAKPKDYIRIEKHYFTILQRDPAAFLRASDQLFKGHRVGCLIHGGSGR
jgi:hypothetical protein